MEKKLNSATASFFELQRLGTLQQGLSFRALRQLYIVYVTTIADFGVPLWYNNNKQGLLIRRYQNLQNMAIRHMLGAFKGSPIRALELEAALPPPEIRFEKLCNMYALRALRFQSSHPIMKAIQNITNDELREQNSHPVSIAYIPVANTQLLALLQRVKRFVTGNWNIEKPHAEWEPP